MNFVLLASNRKILARLIHKDYLFYFNIGVNGEAYFAFLYSFIILIVDFNHNFCGHCPHKFMINLKSLRCVTCHFCFQLFFLSSMTLLLDNLAIIKSVLCHSFTNSSGIVKSTAKWTKRALSFQINSWKLISSSKT